MDECVTRCFRKVKGRQFDDDVLLQRALTKKVHEIFVEWSWLKSFRCSLGQVDKKDNLPGQHVLIQPAGRL